MPWYSEDDASLTPARPCAFRPGPIEFMHVAPKAAICMQPTALHCNMLTQTCAMSCNIAAAQLMQAKRAHAPRSQAIERRGGGLLRRRKPVWCREPHPVVDHGEHAVDVRRVGPQGYEHVHVGGAVPQGPHRPHVELPPYHILRRDANAT